MFRILKKSLKTGVVTGQHPEAAPLLEASASEAKDKAKPFRSSLAFRAVDTGSCNACEMAGELAGPISKTASTSLR